MRSKAWHPFELNLAVAAAPGEVPFGRFPAIAWADLLAEPAKVAGQRLLDAVVAGRVE